MDSIIKQLRRFCEKHDLVDSEHKTHLLFPRNKCWLSGCQLLRMALREVGWNDGDVRSVWIPSPKSKTLRHELELTNKGEAGECRVGYISSRKISLVGDPEKTSITGICYARGGRQHLWEEFGLYSNSSGRSWKRFKQRSELVVVVFLKIKL